MGKFTVNGWLGLATLLSAQAVQAEAFLLDAEIRSQIIGRQFLWSDGGIAHYGSDGTYSYARAGGVVSRGRWTIGGSQLCVDFGATRRCFQFSRQGNELTVTNWLNDTYRLSPLPEDLGNSSPVKALSACDQTINYQLTVPSSDVPAGMRRFWGVWVGAWDSNLCNVLVVQKVFSSGTAQVLYAWGNHVQLKAGSRGLTGTIEGTTLRVVEPNGYWWAEYSLSDATRLSARFHGQGVTLGTVQKRD